MLGRGVGVRAGGLLGRGVGEMDAVAVGIGSVGLRASVGTDSVRVGDKSWVVTGKMVMVTVGVFSVKPEVGRGVLSPAGLSVGTVFVCASFPQADISSNPKLKSTVKKSFFN